MKKGVTCIFMFLSGILLIGANFLFREESMKAVSGVLIGVGASLIGLSVGGLFTRRFEKKNPEIAEQNEIELKDERNMMIRSRAKAKAADITQWFIMGIAYLTILISAPLWVTLAVVAVFLLYNILNVYFMIKYQKMM